MALRFACAALALTTALTLSAVAQQRAPAPSLLPTTTYTLPNGLKVIFHIDRSDPVVSVGLAAHVGSSREEPGRTGFAHMFEHLFFLDSENLGRGGLDKLSARIGGTGANGFTTRDITVYLQEVPKDALEKMIWAEADKLGFFIKTVNDAVLAKEKQVVKNEKRQGVDNQPYGHVFEIAGKALYPADHPYHWQVIGSLADLDAAKLSDVQNFYCRWYVPNNTALVIAGDFDPAQARQWIARYFGEIPAGPAIAPRRPRPSPITASKSLMYEDSYAKLPQLTLAWPGAHAASDDTTALEVLARILAGGRDAPLTKLLVDERKITDAVGVSHQDSELAGEFSMRVRAFDGVDLDQVKAALDEGLQRFEAGGIDAAALARAKASFEVDALEQLTTVNDKVQLMAIVHATTGNPDRLSAQLARARALTSADLMGAYRRYVAGRPWVAVSAVPKGKPALALAGSEVAALSIEPIVQGAEAEVAVGERPTFAPTPSRVDRSEPPFGPPPPTVVPTVWQTTAANGLAISGIEDRELPLATFSFSFDGGQRFDDRAKPGAANLLARMMTRGTARRTPAELENALKALGATVNAVVTKERILLSGSTLSRNYAATMALVREMLLEPRWDAAELALAKAAVTAQIADARANPEALARRVSDVAHYGANNVLARDIRGTPDSVAALTMDELKAFYARNLSPAAARFRITGAVSRAEATGALAPLAAAWPNRQVAVPIVSQAPAPQSARLFFYDVPDAKQSQLMFSAPGPRRADPAYYPAFVTNYILGGGGFASRLTQQLREGKGYTYGIRSRFEGGVNDGRFVIESPVRANVTLEAAQLTREIVGDYAQTFSPQDLDVTKAFLTKSRAFAFESPAGKLAHLAVIGDYGLPFDYPQRERAVIDGMTVEGIRAVAAQALVPDRMTYVIVGDAATQAGRLDALGLGKPILANSLLE
jgi:zinc protease